MYVNPKLMLQLVEVVERGSLTDAADALGLTQPALSRNMKELELQVGAQLLVRGRQGARLTDLGEHAFPYAKSINDTLKRFSVEIESWREGQSGTLIIGASPYPASLLPKVLSQYLEHRPSVTATMEVGGMYPLTERLAMGELDLVIGPVGPTFATKDIQTEPLMTSSLGVFCGADHPLVQKSEITKQDLGKARWLSTPPDTTMRKKVTSILASMGLNSVNFNISVDTIHSAIEMMEVGDHIGIFPKLPLQKAIDRAAVVQLPIHLDMDDWSIAIHYRATGDMPKLASDFAKTLREEFT